MEMTTLGKRLSALRRERNLTQEAVAQQLGVSNQAVSKWESDLCCPDVLLLPKLADLFQVSLDTLFGRKAPQQAHPGPMSEEDLPWEDDGVLRAVLFGGREYLGHQELDRYSREKTLVEFQYTGPARDIQSDFSVTICPGSAVEGNVSAGDGVSCGDVGGSVSAGDEVSCGSVNGNVTAGDGVSCGDVGGSVSAGDDVRCGNVGGSVSAGEDVTCTAVSGSINAIGDFHCTTGEADSSSRGWPFSGSWPFGTGR